VTRGVWVSLACRQAPQSPGSAPSFSHAASGGRSGMRRRICRCAGPGPSRAVAGPSHNFGPHQWRPPRAPHRLRKLRGGSAAPAGLLLARGVSAPERVMSVRDSPGRRRSRGGIPALRCRSARACWGTWPAGDGDRLIGVAVDRHDPPSRIQDPARHRWAPARRRQPPATATPAPKKPKSGSHCRAPDGCRRKKPRPATRTA
jgi:hypothetical protein